MDDLEAIARQRQYRVRTRGPLQVGDALASFETTLRRQQRARGGLGDAWVDVIPEHLSVSCEILGVRAGVLSVRVPDAAARYRLDKFLRSGGEAELVRRADVGLRRVKLVP